MRPKEPLQELFFFCFQGKTSLLAACQEGHSGVTEALLSHGASVSARDSEGQTALHLCARDGHYHAAKVHLLDWCLLITRS